MTIDVKQAVDIAKQQAACMLDQGQANLEEIERDVYKGREVWDITLSFPRDPEQISPLMRFGTNLLQYKRFLIDVQTGDLVAIKLRELASR